MFIVLSTSTSTSTSTIAFLSPRPSLLFTLPSSSFIRSLLLYKNPSIKPSLSLVQAPFSMASSFISAYAKSNRSTCNTCSDTIATNALRLGVISKQKGYPMTKWHHFHCFSFHSHRISSVDSIQGFDSLKSDDQEAVKKLVQEHAKIKDNDEDGTARDEPESTKKRKVKNTGEDATTGDEQKHTKSWKVVDTNVDAIAGDEQGCTKEVKLYVPEDSKVVIAFTTSDIKDSYQDAVLLPNWKAFHTIIFLEKGDGLQDSSKIAAFDFDGCLAKTDVRRTGADAWSLMYDCIPEKLQRLYNDGYKLVIFTNESNITRWKNKRQKAVDSKIGRLNNFIKLVKVPIQVFIACGFGPKDAYRKPKTGMWHVLEQHFNSGIAVDMEKSFYVGDAAGREKDHSDADIKFAQAIGLKFYVPEEFFTE